ncbi:MAG: hypothetical protein OEY64_09990 [Nitrospinota bacterium]|nr:hypothetical protein [Nitrospinota bacterium]
MIENRLCRIKTIIIFMTIAGFAIPANPEEEKSAEIHFNRVIYGDVMTGMRLQHFSSIFPGFTETASGNFVDLEKRSKTDFTILVEKPLNIDLFGIFLKRIPISIFSTSDELACNTPQGARFLSHPPTREGAIKIILYSYDYLVCAGEGVVSGERLLEKYIEKYGNYDKKDYDRNQHIYFNVEKRYEVRVKPVKSKTGEGALIITVSDNEIFKEAYDSWRAYIRRIEESALEKF